MPRVIPELDLDDRDLDWRFVRASGPGGQNVNKVSTAVELRIDLGRLRLAPEFVDRLRTIAGKRVSGAGLLLIDASRHRTQEMNRKDALDKLAQLLRMALHRPKARKATKPTKGSKRRRLASKAARSSVKATRGGPIDFD
ncbi:MAG: aminoacyl-tRNA hydrolase [Rhodospirillales bacterium]|nr:aminoacyl-tRNA hydrolase [Rhodospirillales bacterium]